MIISKLTNQENAPFHLLLEADPNKTLVSQYLEKGELFQAMADEQIIGVYLFLLTGSNQAEIMNIAVEPLFRNQGIGRSLLQHAIEQAREKSIKALYICTGNSSIGQLALYQKMGFRISEIEKDFFTSHYSEEIIENGIICRDKIRLVLYL